MRSPHYLIFFFNDTATTEIYTLSLHDALPISATETPSRASSRSCCTASSVQGRSCVASNRVIGALLFAGCRRSEEHTSELQSRQYLVCRLLLEKKKKTDTNAEQMLLQIISQYQ